MTERRPSLRPRYRPRPVAEIETHLAVVDLLHKACDSTRWEWSHFPAGEKRDVQTGARLKRMGLKRGWPDFIFIHWTKAIYFLELKSHNGELDNGRQFSLVADVTPQQLFHRRMRAWGIECKVARSIDEAIRILTAWGVVSIKTRGAAT